MCAISPGSLLLVTSMGVVMFLLEESVLVLRLCRVALFYKSLGGTVAILGDDTESFGLSVVLVRDV